MIKISTDKGLLGLKELHKIAITLKELVDKNVDIEEVLKTNDMYNNKWNEVIKFLPKEVAEHFNIVEGLAKHSHFLYVFNRRKEPTSCYNDLKEICINDIHNAEYLLMDYLENGGRIQVEEI